MMAKYPVLVGEIAKRGVKKATLAKTIGVSDRTLRNKLAGETAFSLPEAATIRNTFFPDMEMEYLFSVETTRDSA